VLAGHAASLLCAYRIDPFHRHAHRGGLHRVVCCHSHLVPVDDYERLDRAVERALDETFGSDAEELCSLLTARYPSVTSMPAAEETLFAVRCLSPSIGDALLDRGREHYRSG